MVNMKKQAYMIHAPKNRNIRLATLAFVCGLYVPGLMAEPGKQADSFYDAIVGGQPTLQFRTRFEHVNQDGKDRNANAWTFRTLAGWQTLPFHEVSVTAEIINLAHLTNDFYDNKNSLGKSSPYPTVADPEITDINQLYIDYTGLRHTRVRYGRQIVRLDNFRFIGDVIFRQNSQVFDGLNIVNNSVENVELMAAYFTKLRQVTDRVRDTDLGIVHAAWKFLPKESLTGYGYFQNQPATGQNTGFSDNSNQIIGLRANGLHALNADWGLLYTAEYAKQTPYADGNALIDAHYSRMGIGADWHGFYVRLDQEVLSSNDSRYAFQTPLATLHPFQGWTDILTTTPRQGIRDTFLGMGGKWQQFDFIAEWHQMNAEHAFASLNGGQGNRYGQELDAAIGYTQSKHFSGRLEYARFNEQDIYGTSLSVTSRKRDKEIVWVTATYTY